MGGVEELEEAEEGKSEEAFFRLLHVTGPQQ